MNIESYTRIDENAKIAGVALIPRISRNQNLYTKEELKRFDGITVPLNWEHNGDKVIGQATFHYNSETETVFYEGEITDSSAAILAKNRLLYTSIEATPTSVKQVCNGQTDCFNMPFGLKPEALAITETPGVPETSVSVIENYILKECDHHGEFKKYGAEDIIHKTIKPRQEEGMEDTRASADNIMQDISADRTNDVEEQIKYKKEVLDLFKAMADENPEPMIIDQIHMLEQDLQFLANELISIRKDSEYISVEHSLESIVTEMKERYTCDCCGEVKKNEN